MKILMLKCVAWLALSIALAVPAAGALAATPTSAPAGIANNTCTYLKQANGGTGTISGCGTNEPGITSGTGLAHEIVYTFLYTAGIISFIFVLIGGFNYITSTGDSTRIQRAKDTVLYAIIGLIVTFVAIPIAGFVISKVGG